MMFACMRIGAIDSVVFGGFSAEALRDRILRAIGRCEEISQEISTLEDPSIVDAIKHCAQDANACHCFSKPKSS